MGDWKRFRRSFGHAIDGIFYTIKTQRNMQIHIGAAILALLLSFSLRIPLDHVILVFFSIFLVLSMEMVNTAIESVVNLATSEWHPLAKIAKDVAAGAVLITVILSLIVGIYVFLPPLLAIWEGWRQ